MLFKMLIVSLGAITTRIGSSVSVWFDLDRCGFVTALLSDTKRVTDTKSNTMFR